MTSDAFGFGEAAVALEGSAAGDNDLDLSAFAKPQPKAVDRTILEATRQDAMDRGFTDRQATPRAKPDVATAAPGKRIGAGRGRKRTVQQPGTISISGELDVLEAFARRARWERVTQAVLIERMLAHWSTAHGPIDENFE
jgi:hypothetical protein